MEPLAQPVLELGRDELATIVRRATGIAETQVANWQVTQLMGGRETISEIYRIDVRVQQPQSRADDVVPLVLKRVRRTAEREPTDHWNYWLREAEAYASGTLAALPPGLTAPKCYGVGKHEDVVSIWLEHMASPPATQWTETELGTVCFELGRFNGAYLDGVALPMGDWATRHWLRQYVGATVGAIEQLPELQHHPLVGRSVAPHLLPPLLQLVEERERWLAFLESLPQVFCHQDIHWGNLLGTTTVGTPRLVAIDWSFTGVAAVGQELATILFTNRRMPNVHTIATQHYIAGLRAAGWNGDATIVRASSALSVALNYGVAMVGFFLGNLLDERQHADLVEGFGVAIEQLPPRVNPWVEFALGYTNLAREIVSAQ